jgi:glycosyltransferase involved in cell wall biosynthesis
MYIFLNFIFFVGVLILSTLILSIQNKQEKKRLSKEKNKALVVTSYAISYDGRVRNCANFFVRHGFDTTLVKPEDCLETGDIASFSNYRIEEAGFSRSFRFPPFFFDITVFLRILKSSGDVIHCHDLPSGFMGLMVKTLKNNKILIMDFHEWWSESIEINHTTGKISQIPFFRKLLSKFLENFLVNNADYLVTVSNSVARMLQRQSSKTKQFIVAKNFPEHSEKFDDSLNLRKILKIPSEAFLAYYVGQLGHHRKVDIFIKALKFCPNVFLVFRVTNHICFEEFYQFLIEEIGCKDRVFFLPPVSPKKVANSCLGADLGLNCGFMDSKNMQAALPNKLFEYTLAGIPILSVFNEEINAIVEQKGIGATFKDENSVEEVAHFLEKCYKDKIFFREIEKNVANYKKEIRDHMPYEELKMIFSNENISV